MLIVQLFLVFSSVYSGLDASHFTVNVSLDLPVHHFPVRCAQSFSHFRSCFPGTREGQISELFNFVIIQSSQVSKRVVDGLTRLTQILVFFLPQEITRFALEETSIPNACLV